MKTKTILLSCGVLISAFACLVFFKTITSEKNVENAVIEALAATECLTSPGDNTGRCRESANGTGNLCIKASLLKNCFDHVDL